VSNIHATADARAHQISAFFTTAIDVAATVEGTIQGLAMRIVAAIEQRILRRRLTRLPDHMLLDLGFERDWDGAIRSLRDLD